MKREDIIDSMEYIDEDLIREADGDRDAGNTSAHSGKVIPVAGRNGSAGRTIPARRWGTLVASLAVLIVAAFVITGVLRGRYSSMDTVQSAKVAEIEEDHAEQYEAEEFAAFEPAGAAAENEAPNEMIDADAVPETAEETEIMIRVTSDAGEIVFALNDSPAAESLVTQLPLTVDTEPYSGNEIIFHPEEPLDTENGIEGGGTAGALGYFEPWNNVVMYYGDFEAYPGLYILGEAVSGAENINAVSGTITIDLL